MPDTIPPQQAILLPDLDASERLGHAIAAQLGIGDVVALHGEVGAGKTSLARAILRARGHQGETPSPTFTLMQTYDVEGFAIAHLDLYRLKSPDDIAELGLDEALSAGAALIEWPGQAGDLLPRDRLDVQLESEPQRHAVLSGAGSWAARADAIVKGRV